MRISFAWLCRPLSLLTVIAVLTTALLFTGTTIAQKKVGSPLGAVPQYQIIDIGVVAAGDTASQGFGVSTGGTAVGRSVRNGAAQAFTWSPGGAITGLPNLSGRAYCVSNSSNNTGTVVGTCSASLFGTSRLPTVWQNGVVSQLPLPAGETLGDANDVNASGVAVGSINSGTLQRAAFYSGGTATVITQTTSGGSFFTTAFGINDSGRVAGIGIDPGNAARNVGMVWDIGSGTAIDIGGLPGMNGAIAFGISNTGFVVGSSMLNQGSGMPFIWSPAGGMVAIPLPTGTSQGSARGVNAAGMAVGTASSAFAIPFLYDGSSTYRLADLIPAGTGWDLSTNTSSSAMAISDSNVIVGTGVLNGHVHAYAMIPSLTVSVGGRVLTSNGGGLRNARVTVSGGDLPSPVTIQTGSFGYYSFPGLHIAQTYTITVESKKFVITQPVRSVMPTANVTDLNFVAEPLW